MKLSDTTLAVLKCFSAINTNIVIKQGSKISTISASQDILAEYKCEEKFDKQVSIYNLNELLSVIASFSSPELELDDKFLTVKEGKNKVMYVYADESLLTKPPEKTLSMPNPEVSFTLAAESLVKIQKMAGILGVDDISIVGDGKSLTAKVCDISNPTGNKFELDLDTNSVLVFMAHFKVDKFTKLFAGEYAVEISSKKISKFTNKSVQLVEYLAVEADSEFS